MLKPITASDLTERITIQQEIRVPDGMGGDELTWQDLATVWARVLPQRGRERLTAVQQHDSIVYLVTIRRRSDVTSAMRVLWGERVMNIRNVSDAGGRKLFFDLDCETGVTT